MTPKNCLIIATRLGLSPGCIEEAIAMDGSPGKNPANWKCFTSAAEAQNWARAHSLDLDGKTRIIVPHFTAKAVGHSSETGPRYSGPGPEAALG